MQEEDSHKDQSSAPTTSIPVMSDVKPAEPTVPESTVQVSNNESAMATPPKDDVMPDLASEAEPSADAAPAQVTAAAPSATDAIKKKNGMGMVIGIVVGVVIVLAAVGYFALAKKDKTTSSETAATSQSVTAAKADPAAASATIDSNLSPLDQTKDFNSADLSDTSLGL